MRRLLIWYLPLLAALAAAGVFLYGFVLGITGSAGKPLEISTGAAIAPEVRTDASRVLILGDSLARGTGDAEGLGIGGNLLRELRQRKVKIDRMVNLAVNGSRTADLSRQLESRNVQRLIAESGVVIVSIGGNDLFGLAGSLPGRPPDDPAAVLEEVRGRLTEVIGKVREANPRGRIFLVGLYNPFAGTPEGSRVSAAVAKWNSAITEQYADDPNFTLVQTADIFSHRDRLSVDRFHPGTEAYRIIGRRIAEAM